MVVSPLVLRGRRLVPCKSLGCWFHSARPLPESQAYSAGPDGGVCSAAAAARILRRGEAHWHAHRPHRPGETRHRPSLPRGALVDFDHGRRPSLDPPSPRFQTPVRPYGVTITSTRAPRRWRYYKYFGPPHLKCPRACHTKCSNPMCRLKPRFSWFVVPEASS